MILGGLFGEARRQLVLHVGAPFGHSGSERTETVVITRSLDGGRAVTSTTAAATTTTTTVSASVPTAAIEDGVKLGLVLSVLIILLSLLQFGNMFDILGNDGNQIKFSVCLLNMNHLMHLLQQFIRRLVTETLEGREGKSGGALVIQIARHVIHTATNVIHTAANVIHTSRIVFRAGSVP